MKQEKAVMGLDMGASALHLLQAIHSSENNTLEWLMPNLAESEDKATLPLVQVMVNGKSLFSDAALNALLSGQSVSDIFFGLENLRFSSTYFSVEPAAAHLAVLADILSNFCRNFSPFSLESATSAEGRKVGFSHSLAWNIETAGAVRDCVNRAIAGQWDLRLMGPYLADECCALAARHHLGRTITSEQSMLVIHAGASGTYLSKWRIYPDSYKIELLNSSSGVLPGGNDLDEQFEQFLLKGVNVCSSQDPLWQRVVAKHVKEICSRSLAQGATEYQGSINVPENTHPYPYSVDIGQFESDLIAKDILSSYRNVIADVIGGFRPTIVSVSGRGASWYFWERMVRGALRFNAPLQFIADPDGMDVARGAILRRISPEHLLTTQQPPTILDFSWSENTLQLVLQITATYALSGGTCTVSVDDCPVKIHTDGGVVEDVRYRSSEPIVFEKKNSRVYDLVLIYRIL